MKAASRCHQADQRLTAGTSESDTLWTVLAASRSNPSSSSRAHDLEARMVLGVGICVVNGQHSCEMDFLEDSKGRTTLPEGK